MTACAATAQGARSIALISGKGGVGKTTLAVNLAIHLAQDDERRVLLFDGDSGLANAHILMGVKPTRSLADLVRGEVSAEAVVERTKLQVDLVAGSSGEHELLAADGAQRARISALIAELGAGYDALIIDCPAGATDAALHYAAAADRIVVVVTTEPTSFLDAYSTVKELNATYKRQRFEMIVNVAGSEQEARSLFARFQSVSSRFLDVELHYLGGVRRDQAISSAIRRCVPLVLQYPTAPAARDIAALAQRLGQQLRPIDLARSPDAWQANPGPVSGGGR